MKALPFHLNQMPTRILRHNEKQLSKFANEKEESLLRSRTASLISCNSDSREQQIRKFLNEFELGDRKPSELLREMKTLAGDHVDEHMLQTLWLHRLPLKSLQEQVATGDCERLAAFPRHSELLPTFKLRYTRT
jgi:hypothetical protein